MAKDVVTEPFLKRLALNYLCFYAMLYPIATQFMMLENDCNGNGSLPIQIFQGTVILVLLGLGGFAKISANKWLNLWTFGICYFSIISFYFALLRTDSIPRLELLGTARFLAWFLFAAVASYEVVSGTYWKRLAFSFWFGANIQCCIALVMFVTQGAASTYSNVYASTGSVNVSGKTITSFVTLSVLLSGYWFITQKKRRIFLGGAILLGIAVILISYNRACQLAFVIVCVYTFVWNIFYEKVKTASLCFFFLCLGGLFLYSSFGEVFLTRWNDIVDDQGSGRVTLLNAALNNFYAPSSFEALLIGSGYHKMELIMYKACGAYIGAHNDFFDFLVVFGIVGGIYYFLICLHFLTMGAKSISHNSYEYLTLRASTLFVLLTGFFTGLFQATYTFFMLITIQNYMLANGLKYKEVTNSNSNIGLEDFVENTNVNKIMDREEKSDDDGFVYYYDNGRLDAAFSEINFEIIQVADSQNKRDRIAMVDEVILDKFSKEQTLVQDKAVKENYENSSKKYIDVFFEKEGDFAQE